MRVAGALTILASFMAAVVFSLVPVSVSVLGSSISCDAPVLRVLDHLLSEDDLTGIDRDLEGECFDQSVVRVVIAGAIFAIGAVGGGVMLVFGSPSRESRN